MTPDQALLSVVLEPIALYMPSRIGLVDACSERVAIRQLDGMRRPGSDQCPVSMNGRQFLHGKTQTHGNADGDFQNWRESDDVVVPEDGLDFGEIGFGEIGAGVDRAVVNATDFERQRISFRRNEQIGAEATEFAGQAVADVERDAEGGGSNGHAKSECGAREELAARAAREGVGDEAKEHGSATSGRRPVTSGGRVTGDW